MTQLVCKYLLIWCFEFCHADLLTVAYVGPGTPVSFGKLPKGRAKSLRGRGRLESRSNEKTHLQSAVNHYHTRSLTAILPLKDVWERKTTYYFPIGMVNFFRGYLTLREGKICLIHPRLWACSIMIFLKLLRTSQSTTIWVRVIHYWRKCLFSRESHLYWLYWSWTNELVDKSGSYSCGEFCREKALNLNDTHIHHIFK